MTIKQEEIVIIDDESDIGGGSDVKIKEELVVFIDEDDCGGESGGGGGGPGGGEGGGGGGGGGSSWSFSPAPVAKPMEGLYEAVPPPFLRKTFAMVDDPNTDSIISWSDSRRSFIVWDCHKFSNDLLSKHFKHGNFSSFIRQLNTYGFKKIDSDRWEFANEGFQGGKRYLLKNIKRRNRPSQIIEKKVAATSSWVDSSKFGSEVELEKLKHDQNTMKVEILKLKQQHEDTHSGMVALKERLQSTEYKQKQMVIFMAKAFNSTFIQQFVQHLMQKRELGSGKIAKKQRLVVPPSNENSVETANPVVNCSNQKVVELATIQSDTQSGNPNDQDQKGNAISGTTTPDLNSDNFLQKLLEEDLICENEAGEMEQHQSKIVLELEDLIAKPTECWAGYVKELVDRAVDLESKS